MIVLVVLIVLHTADGHGVVVNPNQITSLREPTGRDHFAPGAHCMVSLTDSKFVAARETCDIVRSMAAKE